MNQLFFNHRPSITLVVLLALMFAVTVNVKAQVKAVKVPGDVVTAPENSAEFPGGMEAFYKFLAANVKYPAKAREANVQGKVFISFIVEKSGALTNFVVRKGPGSGLDEEAVRVLHASPKWKPCRQGGKAVRQLYTVPISFTLATGDKKASTVKPLIAPVGNSDEVASFPGGVEKLYAYLAKTIHYPAAARDKNVQGKVFVSFAVEEDGTLTDVEVARGIGSGCDEEALKAIANGPKWIPGKVNGEAAKTTYTVPINFSLAKS